jgi:hypothetical protein
MEDDRVQRQLTRLVQHAEWDAATRAILTQVTPDAKPAMVHIWQIVTALADGLDDLVTRQLAPDQPTPAIYAFLSALRGLAAEVRDYLEDEGEAQDFQERYRTAP